MVVSARSAVDGHSAYLAANIGKADNHYRDSVVTHPTGSGRNCWLIDFPSLLVIGPFLLLYCTFVFQLVY